MTGLRQRLRCPVCRMGLSWGGAGERIDCSCGATYPVLPGGVPVLLVPERRAQFDALLTADQGGRRMAAEYRRHGSWQARVRGWLRPPSIVYDADTPRRFSWIYDTHGPNTVILSIGGGPGRENPRAVNLNVDAFDSVDIVGDGANLPLADGSVDTVTCNAVIEHVPNPNTVVAEMHRVLKPGGYAQLMVPFVFPHHAYPADYQRYSRSGILELTKAFEPVELSVLTGPTSTMLVLFREYLRILVPGGNRPAARLLLNGLSGWLTFPIKYLDILLNRKPDAAIMAAAFYYLGRK